MSPPIPHCIVLCFFFNDTATTEIYTLSLHDALPIYILPGVIDSQVHFREPGLEHKEDLASGSMAAVLGGVTTVFEMPNTDPLTTSAEALADKIARGRAGMFSDFAFYVGATRANVDELPELERLPGSACVTVSMRASTGNLLFAAEDNTNLRELWISDGTAIGTRLITDFDHPLGSGGPEAWANLDGTAIIASGGHTGGQLWALEGAPDAPTAVSATSGDHRKSTVSWTAPVDDGVSLVTSYTVIANPGSRTCSTSSTSCIVSGLNNGTSYTFTVTATNSAGTSDPSAASAPVS